MRTRKKMIPRMWNWNSRYSITQSSCYFYGIKLEVFWKHRFFFDEQATNRKFRGLQVKWKVWKHHKNVEFSNLINLPSCYMMMKTTCSLQNKTPRFLLQFPFHTTHQYILSFPSHNIFNLNFFYENLNWAFI